MKHLTILLAVFFVTASSPLKQADDVSTDDSRARRMKRSINLPVSPGNSLAGIKKLWDAVPNDLYSSKIEISIKNFSKWLMSHISTTSDEGTVGVVSNLVAPGVQEAFISYQSSLIPIFDQATKGSTTWRITLDNATFVDCKIAWNVPVTDPLGRRCKNSLHLSCSDKDPTYSYSATTIVSILHCHENLFCLRGIMPTTSEAIVYVSLFPKFRKDWWADSSLTTIDQAHIDVLLEENEDDYDTDSEKCCTLTRFIGFLVGCPSGLLLLLYCFLRIYVNPALKHKAQQGESCK